MKSKKAMLISLAVGLFALVASTISIAGSNKNVEAIDFFLDEIQVDRVTSEGSRGEDVQIIVQVLRDQVPQGRFMRVIGALESYVTDVRLHNAQSQGPGTRYRNIVIDLGISDGAESEIVEGNLLICKKESETCDDEIGRIPLVLTIGGSGRNPDADLDPEMAAIDSDGNGIWDDAELIVQEAAASADGSTVVRQAAVQMVMAMQDVVRNLDAEPEKLVEVFDAMSESNRCLDYTTQVVEGIDIWESHDISREIEAAFFGQSRARGKGRLEAGARMEEAFPFRGRPDARLEDRGRFCTFNLSDL